MYHKRLKRGGFTLVELLVVIGVIALLIAILMPALSKAREQSKSVKCLSNLRQIGMAIQMYATANNGILVPGWIGNPTGGGRGIENYATILVGLKYLPAPIQFDFDSVESQGDSVFRCPDGVDVKHETGANAAGLGWPLTKQDARGAQYWRRQSVANGLGTLVMVDTWYGINMFDPGGGQGAGSNFEDSQRIWPFRKMVRQNDGSVRGEWSKLVKFKKSSQLALMYDGLRWHDADMNRVNARHNRQRYTNFLLADGHCETIETATLPNLTPAQMRGSNWALFDPYPHPKWRLDQP